MLLCRRFFHYPLSTINYPL